VDVKEIEERIQIRLPTESLSTKGHWQGTIRSEKFDSYDQIQTRVKQQRERRRKRFLRIVIFQRDKYDSHITVCCKQA